MLTCPGFSCLPQQTLLMLPEPGPVTQKEPNSTHNSTSNSRGSGNSKHSSNDSMNSKNDSHNDTIEHKRGSVSQLRASVEESPQPEIIRNSSAARQLPLDMLQ